MYKYYILVLFAGLLACQAKAQKPPTPALQLSYFASIPDSIDGCMGAYTYDTASLKKERYILITNLQTLAMIRVDGKIIYLHQISNSQPGKDTNRDVYKGSGYTVIVIVKDVKQTSDEVTYETGTIEVKYGAVDIVYKIHGTAGC